MVGTAPESHRTAYPQAVLVTGSAQRIGCHIARDFATQGWGVAVHYNESRDQAENLVGQIQASGGRAVALGADLSQESETQGLVQRACDQLGPLGCLVNNASVFEHDHIEDATRQSWDRHIEINLRAPMVLIQSFASALPTGACGSVINILDQRVWNLPDDYVSYSLSKSGLWTLTQSLAKALAPRIRINAIGPGYALAERGVTPDQYGAAVRQLPLGRSTDPEEICRAIRFLLTCGSITGQMLAMDGGEHLA
ncbi:MAG: SDR family oxidoreductase [Pseudomonadota bacterium]